MYDGEFVWFFGYDFVGNTGSICTYMGINGDNMWLHDACKTYRKIYAPNHFRVRVIYMMFANLCKRSRGYTHTHAHARRSHSWIKQTISGLFVFHFDENHKSTSHLNLISTHPHPTTNDCHCDCCFFLHNFQHYTVGAGVCMVYIRW